MCKNQKNSNMQFYIKNITIASNIKSDVHLYSNSVENLPFFSLNIQANLNQKTFWTRFVYSTAKDDLMLKKWAVTNVNEQKWLNWSIF